MTPNKMTGLVDVVDRGTKEPTHLKMWPVDYKEAHVRGGVLKSDNAPRFVLLENYTDPASQPDPNVAPES